MIDTIGFDIGKAKKSEASIRRQLERLDAVMEKLQKAVDDTSSWWEGGSRDAFMRRANAFLAKKSDIAYVITSLADNMATTIRFKKEQEDEAAEIISNAGESPPGGVISVLQDIANNIPDMINKFFESIPGIIESNEEKRIMQTGWYITAEAAAAGALGIWKDPATGKWQLNVKDDAFKRIVTRDIDGLLELCNGFAGQSYEEKVTCFNEYISRGINQSESVDRLISAAERPLLTIMLINSLNDNDFLRFLRQYPNTLQNDAISQIVNQRWEPLLEEAVNNLRDCGMGVADDSTVYDWAKILQWLSTDPRELTKAQVSALSIVYNGMIDLHDTILFRMCGNKYSYNEDVSWIKKPWSYEALYNYQDIPSWARQLGVVFLAHNSISDSVASVVLTAIMIQDSIAPSYNAKDNKRVNIGLNISWPILDQKDKSTDVPKVKMGHDTADKSGCGWIAIGNVLHILGQPIEPWKIVDYFDTHGGVVDDGKEGVNLAAIPGFFKTQGIDATIDYFPEYVDEQIRDSGVAIFNFLRSDNTAHYIAVEYINGEYVIYNDTPNDPELAKSSITAWMLAEGWLPLSVITFK